MGGMTSSQSTSTPKMPGYVKDLYKDIYKDVNKAYNKGKANVFTNPTFAGLTDQQNRALGGMMDTANANSGGNGMSGSLQNILNNGGFNQGQQNSLGQMWGLANNGGLQALANGNGFSQSQNNTMNQMQNATGENTAYLQSLFNQGGLNSGQQAALDRLTQQTGANSSALQNLIAQGGLTGAQGTALTQATKSMLSNPFQGLMSGTGMSALQQDAYSGLSQNTNFANTQLRNLGTSGQNAELRNATTGIQNMIAKSPFQDVMNGSGMTQDQAQAYRGLQAAAGDVNSRLSGIADRGGLTADQRGAMDRYTQDATSSFDINANPAYAQVRQRALDAGAQSVTGQAAKMGRLGGAANQNILARAQSDTAANMDLGEYRNWQSRKDAANAALMQGGQMGMGNTLSALGQMVGNKAAVFNAAGQGMQNRLAATNAMSGLYGQLAGLGQQAIGNQTSALGQLTANSGNMLNAAGTGLSNQFNASNALQGIQNNVANLGQMGVNNQANAINQQQGLQNNLINQNQVGINNQSNQANQIQGMQNNLLNAQQQGVNNQQNAVNTLSGLQGQYFNANQAGLGNMGTAYQTAQQPYQSMMNVGGVLQNQNQNLINDQIRMFNESNPMNIYSQYLQLASGMPTGQVTTTQPSTLQTLLTAGLGGAGIFGSLFSGGGAPAAGGAAF